MATSSVNTPWQDRAEFEKVAARQVDVQDVIQQLQNALDPGNLRKASPQSPEWARYGYAAVDPSTKTFVQPTMYNNQQYVGAMQKQLSAALHEDVINKAAMELYSPYTPPPSPKPLPVQKPPPGQKLPALPTPKISGGMGTSGIIGLLLELLTHSEDTNSNESEQLQAKRGAGYTNKPEYDALLQQVLNSGNATFPK